MNSIIFPSIRLHEFFQVNVEKLTKQFREELNKESVLNLQIEELDIQIIQDSEYQRFGSTIDIEKSVLLFNVKLLQLRNTLTKESFITKCCEEFSTFLHRRNSEMEVKAQSYCQAAINAILGHVRYERVTKYGPRCGEISSNSPLVTK